MALSPTLLRASVVLIFVQQTTAAFTVSNPRALARYDLPLRAPLPAALWKMLSHANVAQATVLRSLGCTALLRRINAPSYLPVPTRTPLLPTIGNASAARFVQQLSVPFA